MVGNQAPELEKDQAFLQFLEQEVERALVKD